MVLSLQALGHTVPFDDASAPVQISFSNPLNYKFHEGQYKIGYTPWESTTVPAPWLPKMNECDEVWATSPWVAEVYRKAGVKPPIYVFEHGIDPHWQPVSREPDGVVRFLHVGEPALRKGGQMALDAFREAFGDRTDVHLTLKGYYQHYLRGWSEKGYGNAEGMFENVTVMPKEIKGQALIDLYGAHDVMVYPSYGEGFGFIPLQALAMGMPTICTDGWCSYSKFLGPLKLTGRWDRSIWSIHPGNVYYPDYPALVKLYEEAAAGIDYYKKIYSAQVPDVQNEYDWLTRTENAIEHVVERFTDKDF